MATPHCNIVADTEKEEDKTKALGQFAKSENHSKLITGLELQNSHLLVVNFESQEKSPQHDEEHEELNQIQHSASLQEKSKIT